MELHSYAKRRTLKKWNVEQKRKLVEVRIAHDDWFINKPSSVVPWKNILIAANLDDFNVFFVRKQWSNMLARYKQYKQSRLGNNTGSKAIDAELIKRINQEWEFFEPIHKFMTRQTTNLHSYAITHRTDDNHNEKKEKGVELVEASTITEQQQYQKSNKSPTKLLHNETITVSKPRDCAKENIPNNSTIALQSNNISQNDGILLFSSDTNEEFQIVVDTTRIKNGSKVRKLSGSIDKGEKVNCVRNTDHDFYSKRSSGEMMISAQNCKNEDELLEEQSNYFADASEESQGSSNMVIDLLQVNKSTNSTTTQLKLTTRHNNDNPQATAIKTEVLNSSESLKIKKEILDEEFLPELPSTSTQNNITQHVASSQPSSKSRLSERDKYYRHKRRFNRRLEKRFDAMLQVMGQVVKAGYPNIDMTPLIGTVSLMAANMGKTIISDSEDDNESDENM